MKVQEIISEEWSLNPLKWGAKPTPAQLRTAASAVRSGTPEWIAKLGVKRLANEAAALKMAERMGPITALAKLLGFFYITVELYQNLEVLERAYNEGKIDSANYKKAHEAYIGLWMTQAMVPWLVKILAVQRIASFLVRAVLAIATLGATAATGGALAPAALAGIVIEQAAFTALQTFLASDTFKNWAKDYMVAFATIGHIPDELFNQLRGYISEIPGMDKIMKNPGKTFYQSQDLKRSPDVRAKDKTTADGNAGSIMHDIRDDPDAVVIAGNRVDDGKGGVNRLVAAGPQVQAAIKLHPEDPMVQKYLKLTGK